VLSRYTNVTKNQPVSTSRCSGPRSDSSSPCASCMCNVAAWFYNESCMLEFFGLRWYADAPTALYQHWVTCSSIFQTLLEALDVQQSYCVTLGFYWLQIADQGASRAVLLGVDMGTRLAAAALLLGCLLAFASASSRQPLQSDAAAAIPAAATVQADEPLTPPSPRRKGGPSKADPAQQGLSPSGVYR